MSIGYACIALAVPQSNMKNCTLKNANEDNLLSLIDHNLNSLSKIIDYNIQNGIMLFRISSDLIPFGSSIAAKLPWQSIFAEKLLSIGNKITNSGMRVSMHPGQYTVLNSPDNTVASRAVEDLEYHTQVLDCMGLGSTHKIILHLGGVYNDKEQSIKRFISRYKMLDPCITRRLVLENDGVSYNIRDVLEAASLGGFPVVFDNHHNNINPANPCISDIEWVMKCSATWKKGDGLPKIHYSQQHGIKKSGAHSESIEIDDFLRFYRQLSEIELDIMLEVKDKNISAIKCINCVSYKGIEALEAEWARYKYTVLEHSAEHYGKIRIILRDKNSYPALEMYHLIETAISFPIVTGNAVNALEHVWGYFKKKASELEKRRFQNLLENYRCGKITLTIIKNNLFRLSIKYSEHYLLNSYYFQ